jgi:hypothetical protein
VDFFGGEWAGLSAKKSGGDEGPPELDDHVSAAIRPRPRRPTSRRPTWVGQLATGDRENPDIPGGWLGVDLPKFGSRRAVRPGASVAAGGSVGGPTLLGTPRRPGGSQDRTRVGGRPRHPGRRTRQRPPAAAAESCPLSDLFLTLEDSGPRAGTG